MSESPPLDLSLDYDVVIVGAGLSGLTAARELRKKASDLRVLIVEAKDRVGGRTLTVSLKGARDHVEQFDLGGQWVGNTQKHVLNLLDDLKIEKYAQYVDGNRWSQAGFPNPREYNESLPSSSFGTFSFREIIDLQWNIFKTQQLASRVNLLNLFKWRSAHKYDDMTLSQWSKANCWTRTTRETMDILSRALYGAESSKINMLYHLAHCKSAGNFKDLLEDIDDGAQAFRIKGGAQQLSTRIAEELGFNNIWFNQAITNVDVYENSGTTIVHLLSTDGSKQIKKIVCSQLILAIPPSQCNKITFTPALPNDKLKIFQSVSPGHYIKAIITYETAFWREMGYSGNILSTGRTIIPGEVLPIFFASDDTSENGVPALVVFLNDEYADMTTEERCNLVTNDLMRFLGDKAMHQFIDYKEKIWSREPYNGGCPVDIVPTGEMHAWQSLREPFLTVHFAGTETATEWMGYMNGAIQSGLRASHEVLQEMEKFNAVSFSYLKGTKYDSDYRPPLPESYSYDITLSPWWRRIFFASFLCIGIFAYSKKYQLSFFAKTVKPIENRIVFWTTGIEWPT